MAAPHQWTFTTATATDARGVCPCTVFDDNDQPDERPGDDTSSRSARDGVQEQRAGTISGVRFYKNVENGGTHTVGLWDRTSTKLATGHRHHETTTGWQQANFDSSGLGHHWHHLRRLLHGPQGRYSAAGGGLRPRSPGSALPRGDGGRYNYRSTGAPSTTSKANYFVDPVFDVGPGSAARVVAAPRGTEPPRSVSAQVTAVLRQQRPARLGQIAIRRRATAPVAGNMANETAGPIATFTPAGPLDAGTRYTVTVTGARQPRAPR